MDGGAVVVCPVLTGLAALIASAGLTRAGYVGNCQDGGETHDFTKLLLGPLRRCHS